MKRVFKSLAVAAGLAVSITLAQSCSDPASSGDSGGKATIDEVGVATGIAEMSTIFAVCQTTGSQAAAVSSPAGDEVPSLLARLLEMRALVGAGRTSSFSSNDPADNLGECGGRATYSSYDHNSGTTTATYEYQNYCFIDSETGNETTLNGSLAFKETGTPGDYGPIISKLEADSPGGVTETTRSSGGQVLSSRMIGFEDYEQTMGVPGGAPTSSNPDRIKATEFSFDNQTSGKGYRYTKFSSSNSNTASGGEQTTVSGRGFRSNGEYYDFSTTSPITSDFYGDYTGGTITFTGADNSTAVLSVVPGSVPQGTLTLNGEPVAGVPVCR